MRETAEAAGPDPIPDSTAAATPENSFGNAALLNTPAAVLIDLMPDAVFLYDHSGRIVRVNPGARGLFALDSVPNRDTASFEQRVALLAPRDLDGRPLPRRDWHVTRLLRGETIHSTDPALACITGFDGRDRVVSYTGAPIRDATDAIIGAIAIGRDVTRQVWHEAEQSGLQARERVAQAEVATQAAKLQATFEAVSDGLIVFDSSGHLVEMNSAARTLLMLDEDLADYSLSAVGSSRFSVRDEQGRPVDMERWPITRVMRGEVLAGANAADVVISSLDGREHQLSVTGAPVRGEHGDVLGAVCIMHDVTERRRLERHTRDALAALVALAEAAVTIPAVEASPPSAADGASDAASDTAARKLAALARQVIGCTRVAIICLDEMQRLVPIAVTGVTRGEERQWRAMFRDVPLAHLLEEEQISRLREGEVFALDTALPPQHREAFGAAAALLAPMRIDTRLLGILSLDPSSGDGTYSGDDQALAAAVAQLVGLVLDRERLLRDRAAAQSRALALEETNYLMSEFLGIAGHELRTPLTSIRANAQFALRTLRTREVSPRDPAATLERLHPLIARIENQSHRQERLVNDLLDVSRIEAGRLELHDEPVDLAAIVRECVEEHRLLYPDRTIALTLPAGAHPVPVVSDADRIGQVLTNYLSNALKYSTDDSPVTVRLRIRGGRPQVQVGDAGPGLPPEERARVWDRFHRAPGVEVRSGSGIGLGLGLFISKVIIERHGGSVGVKSRRGQGSIFWFTLPPAQHEYAHWPE